MTQKVKTGDPSLSCNGLFALGVSIMTDETRLISFFDTGEKGVPMPAYPSPIYAYGGETYVVVNGDTHSTFQRGLLMSAEGHAAILASQYRQRLEQPLSRHEAETLCQAVEAEWRMKRNSSQSRCN